MGEGLDEGEWVLGGMSVYQYIAVHWDKRC